MALVVLSALACLLISFGLTLCSDQILSTLDTNDRYAGKPALRFLYNLNLRLQGALLYIYNTLVGHSLRGTDGGRVDYILVYPIASVSGGVKVTRWELRHYGFKGDRQYMVAHWDAEKKQYAKISINKCPKLAAVKASWCDDTQMFRFVYNDSSFELPIEITDGFLRKHSSNPDVSQKINVWKLPIGMHVLDKVLPPRFIQDLGLPSDTVLVCSVGGKPCKIGVRSSVRKETTFQAYYPILMIGQESFDWMASQCGKDAPHHTMSSWRPNLVINGTPGPFAEDQYSVFDILTEADGGKRHRCDAPVKCQRCNMPNVDYSTGEFDQKHTITKTLARTRRVDEAFPNCTYFGKYVVNIDENYVITRGDPIDVIQKQCTYWTENVFP